MCVCGRGVSYWRLHPTGLPGAHSLGLCSQEQALPVDIVTAVLRFALPRLASPLLLLPPFLQLMQSLEVPGLPHLGSKTGSGRSVGSGGQAPGGLGLGSGSGSIMRPGLLPGTGSGSLRSLGSGSSAGGAAAAAAAALQRGPSAGGEGGPGGEGATGLAALVIPPAELELMQQVQGERAQSGLCS